MKDKDLMASKIKRKAARFIVYLFAIVIALTAFYPFYVMIISATHDNYNIVAKINIFPGSQLAQNYARLTQNIELYRGILNSVILAVAVTLVQNYFTAMAAYAFSKFNFKGKNALFGVVMVAMMLPGQLGIIGFYKEIQAMNLLNNYFTLIVPTIANCFAVFFYGSGIEIGKLRKRCLFGKGSKRSAKAVREMERRNGTFRAFSGTLSGACQDEG